MSSPGCYACFHPYDDHELVHGKMLCQNRGCSCPDYMLPPAPMVTDERYQTDLRDWFAGQALAGLHARGDSSCDGSPEGIAALVEVIARLAYAQADAMLAERGKEAP